MNKAREICMEMLHTRGYDDITEYDDNDFYITNKDGDTIIVFFVDAPKFNIAFMAYYISIMNNMNFNHAIIIYKDGITPATKKTIDQLHDIKIELFAEEDLQYNITKHVLQPQFEKLTDNKDYQKYKFPIMKSDDPIARFYGYSKGDIIKITRKDGFISYRIVK